MTVATSQNGWLANNRSVIASYSLPGGGKIAVRKGDVATILVYVAKRFDSEVEKLKWPGNWGYAERPIRGSRTTSNHASGTAIDLNAPRHPLGKRGTFSKKQVRAIKKILADCGGVVRWGGNYVSRADEMHFEINAGSAAVRRVAQAIREGKKPGPSGGATSSGGSSFGDSKAKHAVGSRVMKKYSSGTDVLWLQKRLYKLGYDVGEFDGDFGDKVVKGVRDFQKKAKISIDGEVYTDTIKALKAAKTVRDLPKPKSKPKPKKKVKFPLSKGHYYYTESKSSKVHSGYYAKDRAAIRKIQRAVGAGVDGGYGEKTKAKVKSKQKALGFKGDDIDGAVGINTWNRLFN